MNVLEEKSVMDLSGLLDSLRSPLPAEGRFVKDLFDGDDDPAPEPLEALRTVVDRRRPAQQVFVCADTECGGETQPMMSGGYLVCTTCGRCEPYGGNDVVDHGGAGNVSNYNSSENSAIPVTIIGPGHHAYQRKLTCVTSNYKKTQRKTTIEQMTRTVFQYQGNKIPQNLVLAAAEFYCSVQMHCIKRAKVRIGTMAACLYRVCRDNGITRKPKEIADIFGIAQNDLSGGDKILDDLVSQNLITPPKVAGASANRDSGFYYDHQTETENFLRRYFEALQIPIEVTDAAGQQVKSPYYEFVHSLIRFTVKYHIADNSITSSKCAGSIYILVSRCKELQIDRSRLEREFSISKSTFNRFSKAVFEELRNEDPEKKKVRSRLRNIFRKYGVPIE